MYLKITRKALLNFQSIVFALIFILCGCSHNHSKIVYESEENGIRLQFLRNWDVFYHERSGSLFLETRKSLLTKDSARIEILGPACNHSNHYSAEENTMLNIERIKNLYYLNAITINEELGEYEKEGYMITKTVIVVPSLAMIDDPARIQVGEPNSNVYQKIELFDIRDSRGNFTLVYLYPGESEDLNAQAQEIVDSIRIICSNESVY